MSSERGRPCWVHLGQWHEAVLFSWFQRQGTWHARAQWQHNGAIYTQNVPSQRLRSRD